MTDRMMSYPTETDEIDRQYIDSHTHIPDGSFVQAYVTIIAYTPPEGESCWLVCNNTDIPATQVVGMLDLAKLDVVMRTPGLVSRLSPEVDE